MIITRARMSYRRGNQWCSSLTQKLLSWLKQTDNLAVVESTTRLGDWYGNVLQLGRRQHLLFISDGLDSVDIPIPETKRLAGVSGRGVREAVPRRRHR